MLITAYLKTKGGVGETIGHFKLNSDTIPEEFVTHLEYCFWEHGWLFTLSPVETMPVVISAVKRQSLPGILQCSFVMLNS